MALLRAETANGDVSIKLVVTYRSVDDATQNGTLEIGPRNASRTARFLPDGQDCRVLTAGKA